MFVILFMIFQMLPHIFVWNCQGCASPKFVRVVRDYYVEFYIDVEAFLETRVNCLKADRIISKIGLDCSHRIEAKGYAGGLCICWINTFQIQIMLNDPQFTLCHLRK
ncbi:hypothetical protein ES332_D03G069200v1 [Gossypium tomentosum]|uniref:Uncharacterized protein n=1 Tax=Gossypium tomentosum TaxID=34277 RepID=A0A5D2LK73_GOSTO|nr:hypothetical protein ES332_D03G069200v1 [Gossypium tomentosum]